jgi:hypothetical protein
MAGNPTNISHAGELVVGVYVKDVLDSQSGAEEVSTSSMNDTLRLAGGARSLRMKLISQVPQTSTKL